MVASHIYIYIYIIFNILKIIYVCLVLCGILAQVMICVRVNSPKRNSKENLKWPTSIETTLWNVKKKTLHRLSIKNDCRVRTLMFILQEHLLEKNRRQTVINYLMGGLSRISFHNNAVLCCFLLKCEHPTWSQ